MTQNNKVVSIDYKVVDEDDNLIDSSEGREPLVYIHGTGNLIPGLEKALAGKEVGSKFDVTVSPKEAYGEVNLNNIQQVPMSSFKDADKVEVGMSFTANGPNGTFPVIITEVTEETVTVDANHPLAGKTLKFTGEIVAIREATEEELTQAQ